MLQSVFCTTGSSKNPSQLVLNNLKQMYPTVTLLINDSSDPELPKTVNSKWTEIE